MLKEGCLWAIMFALGMFLLGIVFAFIFAYFAMLLWNYAVTAMFNLPEVTYWQMFAFMVLVRCIIMPTNITYKKD